MKKYFGLFKSLADIEDEFKVVTGLGPKDILFAYYDYEDYSGRALVVFVSPEDGLLYLVVGSHCSCHGLECCDYSGDGGTQWIPERTTWEALNKMEPEYLEDAKVAFRKLVESNLKS